MKFGPFSSFLTSPPDASICWNLVQSSSKHLAATQPLRPPPVTMVARILTALALTLPLAAGFLGRPMSPARLGARGSSESSLRMAAASATEVVIIGCGCPKRGMVRRRRSVILPCVARRAPLTLSVGPFGVTLTALRYTHRAPLVPRRAGSTRCRCSTASARRRS